MAWRKMNQAAIESVNISQAAKNKSENQLEMA